MCRWARFFEPLLDTLVLPTTRGDLMSIVSTTESPARTGVVRLIGLIAAAFAAGLMMFVMVTGTSAAMPPPGGGAGIPVEVPPPGGGGDPGHSTPPVPVLTALTVTQQDNLSGHLHIKTTATLSRGNGVIDWHGRLSNTSWGVGGHANVAVVLRDAQGNLIGRSVVVSYGVDAKSVFWNSSDRTYDYYGSVDRSVAAATATIEIRHSTGGVDNFQRDLDQAVAKGCSAAKIFLPLLNCH